MFRLSYIILELSEFRAKSVVPDEVAHYEPPHLDLPCLEIQVFSFLAFLRHFIRMISKHCIDNDIALYLHSWCID